MSVNKITSAPTENGLIGKVNEVIDNIPTKVSELQNDSGYTTNIGTVTSVNNTSPDGNGNVTISIPTTTDSVTSGSTAALTSGGAYTALGNKLDTSKVKSSTSSTSGDVYDVTYINTMLGNIETTLQAIRGV